MSWYDDYQRGVRAASDAADARDADAEALATAYGLTFDYDDGCYPKFRAPARRTVITRCADLRWRSCLGTLEECFNDTRSWRTAREALVALLGKRDA
jgi:hypothetical protein